MTIRGFFSFRENKFFWLNIIAMAIVLVSLVFITLKGIDIYTQHGISVVVPDIKGMSEEEAVRVLKERGLECQVVDSNYVKNILPGKVLEQNPAAGMRVKEGRLVYLTINSLSIPLVNVPDVADNSSLRQAQAKLTAVGFKLAPEEYITGEKDWVYGVKYKGRQLVIGEKVPMEATLTLLVGNGTHETDMVNDSLEVEPAIQPEPSEDAVVDDLWF